jgi:hypothetical protein
MAMIPRTRTLNGARWLLVCALLVPVVAAAQTAPSLTDRSGAIEPEPPIVETAPLRCWWRTSAGAVAIGEPFDVRLTCAVLETDTVQVVPDETRLTVAGVQLTPFEVMGGDHPADTRAGQRRFFQYRYTLRLLDPNEIGQDVSLPRLSILYKVQSRVAADQALAGRDFAYLMPTLTVHVLSQVSEDAADIRDGADVGLERIEALAFRARLLDIGALALLGVAVLLAVSTAVAVVARVGPDASQVRAQVPQSRVLAATDAELTRIAREVAGGWTPELVAAAHATLRVVAAVALGRPVSESPLAHGDDAADGRLTVRARVPGRARVAVSSPTTPADVAAAVEASALAPAAAHRAGLESLQAALATFTAAQFAPGDGALDAAALGQALESSRTEAARLVREHRWSRLWPFGRRARPASWRPEVARK